MSKTLVIGLDGATYDVLLPLMAQGHLPNIASLLPKTSWGRLESTIPPFTAAAWSTFATGCNPGQHGILSFETRDPYHYHSEITGYVDGRQLGDTLWEIISRAGKRVVVVNVPVTYPPRPVNGLMITGMLTPSNAPSFTYPPELAQELEGYRIDVDFIREGSEFRKYNLPSKEEMLAEIQAVTRKRSETCLRLIQEQEWDFFMTVYTGTDRISHFFWDDLTYLLLDSQQGRVAPEIQEGLLNYFQELDRDIGHLIVAAGSDTHVVFMSDHGFGASPTKRFYVNVWLEQQGLLCPLRNQGKMSLDYWRMRIGRNVWLKAVLRRWLSAQAQEQLSQTVQKNRENSDIDWSATQAYFVPIYFHVGGIDINTTPQHREGIVATAAEYESLRDKIIAAIQLVYDPQTGEPMVERVCRREELFSGLHVTQFPDIILVLNPNYVGLRSLAGSQLVEAHEPFRPGDHRADGIFAVSGPAVLPHQDLAGLYLADVSATILYLLGVPIPTSFDGRVLEEVFDPVFWQQNPPQSQEVSLHNMSTNPEALYSAAEEAELERRLRGLGYLE